MNKTTENTNTVVNQAEEVAAKARGERLKILRSLTGLTRDQLCDDGSGLNANTYKDWELGRFSGITTKGAERVIARIGQHNVVCSIEWLMNGTGIAPMVLASNPTITIADSSIRKELSIFQALSQNVLYAEINDSHLAAPYQFGDVVAGVKLPLESITALTGQICLVETAKHETLVMKLLKSLGN
ncbi:MAG: hypothetical protein K2Q33_08810, partial [Gammaproteobacteria bacterium]|nr:hypothetical protein [Gammaproteobacteria bacterium]